MFRTEEQKDIRYFELRAQIKSTYQLYQRKDLSLNAFIKFVEQVAEEDPFALKEIMESCSDPMRDRDHELCKIIFEAKNPTINDGLIQVLAFFEQTEKKTDDHWNFLISFIFMAAKYDHGSFFRVLYSRYPEVLENIIEYEAKRYQKFMWNTTVFMFGSRKLPSSTEDALLLNQQTSREVCAERVIKMFLLNAQFEPTKKVFRKALRELEYYPIGEAAGGAAIPTASHNAAVKHSTTTKKTR